MLDRQAAGGDTFVGGNARITRHNAQRRQRHVELGRRNGRQGRHGALTQLDLAGAHGQDTVRIDGDPG